MDDNYFRCLSLHLLGLRSSSATKNPKLLKGHVTHFNTKNSTYSKRVLLRMSPIFYKFNLHSPLLILLQIHTQMEQLPEDENIQCGHQLLKIADKSTNNLSECDIYTTEITNMAVMYSDHAREQFNLNTNHVSRSRAITTFNEIKRTSEKRRNTWSHTSTSSQYWSEYKLKINFVFSLSKLLPFLCLLKSPIYIVTFYSRRNVKTF
jgi:hypothetical protein